MITEVGGTVGDIEILPFLEAIRQIRLDVGRENVFYLHVTLVPFIGPSAELKTKPTQHSVTELRGRGIQPDAIVCRSERPITDDLKRKISNLCDVPLKAVVNAARRQLALRDPPRAARRGARRRSSAATSVSTPNAPADLDGWRALVARIERADRPVRIGVVGKYVSLPDAYLSVVESLNHAGFALGARIELEWINAEEVEGLLARGRLAGLRRHRHPRRVRAHGASRARSPRPASPASRGCHAWGSAWACR